MTALADVVRASEAVSSTRARSAKVGTLVELLRALEPEEIPIAVGFLSGVPRQGRVGVGYAMVRDAAGRPRRVAPGLTIADVDRAIDAIEAAVGAGSQTRRRELLAELFTRATEPEARFLRELLTGGLRQGALAGVMADAVAKAADVPTTLARRALMLSGDLPAMARIALTEGEAGLRGVGLELFRPILPMLASTAATATDAVAAFDCASVEWKLDGIRIQIHRRGEEIRIYTRNLNEITDRLPGIVDAIARVPLDQVVLDGEALWMGPGGPAPFQETVSLIDSDAPPQGVVTFLFDLLHLDGSDLLDRPLRERAERLRVIAPELEIPRVFTDDPAEAERTLAAAIDGGPRGRRRQGRRIAVRRWPARPGVAQGQAGADVRSRRPRRGVGPRAPSGMALQSPSRRPRPGNRRLRDGRQDVQGTHRRAAPVADRRPARAGGRTAGITVFVRPELVVEIAIDGVQTSTRYPGGIALRFARVKGYRPDKESARGGHHWLPSSACRGRGRAVGSVEVPGRNTWAHRKGFRMGSETVAGRMRVGVAGGRAVGMSGALMLAFALSLVLVLASPVSARSGGCPKPKFLTGHRTALRITCATEGQAGSLVTVTAVWPHDAALFIYFTNKSCATTHAKAKALIHSEGNEGFVFDQLLPAGGDRGWFTEASSVVFRGGPNQFKTTCAMVYARTGAGGSDGRSSAPRHDSSPIADDASGDGSCRALTSTISRALRVKRGCGNLSC